MADDATRKRKLRTLTGLDVERFRHPSDARATDAQHHLLSQPIVPVATVQVIG